MICKKHVFLTIFCLLPLTGLAQTEFECETSVSYEWKKEENVTSVHFDDVKERAEKEEGAKSKVADLAFRAKKLALKACKNEHQNYSGCLTSKLKSLAVSKRSMGFEAQKMLEEAVQKDCESITGVCGEVKMKEIACKQTVFPPAAEEEEEDTKGKKK